MSLPIVDEDDDFEYDEVEHSVAVKMRPPNKPESAVRKLLAVHSGEEECYWCGFVYSKDKMKRITMAGLLAYKCERC